MGILDNVFTFPINNNIFGSSGSSSSSRRNSSFVSNVDEGVPTVRPLDDFSTTRPQFRPRPRPQRNRNNNRNEVTNQIFSSPSQSRNQQSQNRRNQQTQNR